MNEKNELEVWLDHAEDDFNAIQKLLRGKKPSLYGACFHAQQCAEKYMKALLVKHRIPFPKTHDLLTINNLLQQTGIDLGLPEDTLALLSAYAVGARYNEERPEMADAKEALQIAKDVRKTARTFLGLN